METALLQLLVDQGLELLALHDLLLFVIVASAVMTGLMLRDLARCGGDQLGEWLKNRHRGHGDKAPRVEAAPPSASVAATHPPEGVTHREPGAVTDADVSDAEGKCWCETNTDNYRRYHT